MFPHRHAACFCSVHGNGKKLLGRKPKSALNRHLEVLSTRVNFEIYKDVETIARNQGLTLTQVIRQALVEHIAKERRVGNLK